MGALEDLIGWGGSSPFDQQDVASIGLGQPSLRDLMAQITGAIPGGVALGGSPRLPLDGSPPPIPQSRSLAPGPFVPETPLQEPPPSGMDSFWQRVGEATGGQPFGHIAFRRGGKHNDPGYMALLALLSGYANAKARHGLKAGEESRLFRKQAEKDVQDRVAARNAAFTDARTKAKDVRDTRVKQMTKAMESALSDARDADTRARSAGDPSTQANHIAARDAALQRYAQIAADHGKLTGGTPKPAPEFAAIGARTPKPKATAGAWTDKDRIRLQAELDKANMTIKRAQAVVDATPVSTRDQDERYKRAADDLAKATDSRDLTLATMRRAGLTPEGEAPAPKVKPAAAAKPAAKPAVSAGQAAQMLRSAGYGSRAEVESYLSAKSNDGKQTNRQALEAKGVNVAQMLQSFR